MAVPTEPIEAEKGSREISTPSTDSQEKIWHGGNCHCTRIRFRALLPPLTNTTSPPSVCRCDCSICTKNGWLTAHVPRSDIELKVGTKWVQPGVEADGTAYAFAEDVWSEYEKDEVGSPNSPYQGCGCKAKNINILAAEMAGAEPIDKEKPKRGLLPLVYYQFGLKENDIVFCAVCGSSLWCDGHNGLAGLKERQDRGEKGDLVAINVSI